MRLAIALKRAARDVTPVDWADQVGEIEGVRVISQQHGRLVVDVEDDETRQRLERTLGENCRVEPLVIHQQSGN